MTTLITTIDPGTGSARCPTTIVTKDAAGTVVRRCALNARTVMEQTVLIRFHFERLPPWDHLVVAINSNLGIVDAHRIGILCPASSEIRYVSRTAVDALAETTVAQT